MNIVLHLQSFFIIILSLTVEREKPLG